MTHTYIATRYQQLLDDIDTYLRDEEKREGVRENLDMSIFRFIDSEVQRNYALPYEIRDLIHTYRGEQIKEEWESFFCPGPLDKKSFHWSPEKDQGSLSYSAERLNDHIRFLNDPSLRAWRMLPKVERMRNSYEDTFGKPWCFSWWRRLDHIQHMIYKAIADMDSFESLELQAFMTFAAAFAGDDEPNIDNNLEFIFLDEGEF